MLYSFHPLAEVFPLLEGHEFQALMDDIAAHGVREAVWLYDEQILDGRNRYRACDRSWVRRISQMVAAVTMNHKVKYTTSIASSAPRQWYISSLYRFFCPSVCPLVDLFT